MTPDLKLSDPTTMIDVQRVVKVNKTKEWPQ